MIVSNYKMRLDFIKDAWKDKEITKEEKSQIYDNYMDTSKEFNQYLINKENKVETEIQRKGAVQTIQILASGALGALVLVASVLLGKDK